MLDLLRRWLALVSRLVPRWGRREFRAEWDAELTTAWMETPREGRRSWRASMRLARRAAGAIPDAWCLFRQQWSLDMLLQDIRYAFRLMRERHALTAIVVLTLALGIGATTAMFSVVDGVLLRPLPFKDPSRLVRIWENDRLNQKPRYDVAPANFADWQSGTRTFEQMAAFMPRTFDLRVGAETVHADACWVSTNFFDLLGVPPRLGRTFRAAEAIRPHNRVLVLSYTAWQDRFAADPSIIGRSVNIGDDSYQVIGVMPRGFAFPSRTTEVWWPMPRPDALGGPNTDLRAIHFLNVIGRLRPQTTFAQAQADLERVAVRLQQTYPRTNDQRGTTMAPLRESIVGQVRTPLYLLAGAVLVVLLIGCANVANLLLVQAGGRRRELAVRAAVGADRFRIVRQLLVEGLVLALFGGAAGVLVAVWMTSVLAKVAADYVPRITGIGVDGRVLAFALITSLGTGVLFALAPAWTSAGADVQAGLRDGARTGSGRGARRLRSGLAVAELAAAIVLVIAAGLVLRSFWQILAVSPGFAADHLLTADASLPGHYETAASMQQFYATLFERIRAVPGVTAVGGVDTLPMAGSGNTTWLTLENRPRPAGEPPEVGYHAATPGYFTAMRIPLKRGRLIADMDTPSSLKVAVVNEALAARFFPGHSPIDLRVRIGPNPKAPWRTIVGVVGDVHEQGPASGAAPAIYLPEAQDTFELSLAIRTAGDPVPFASTLRAIVASIDPGVSVYHVVAMDDVLSDQLAPRRLAMMLLGAFAAVALGLALLGIYGVMSHVVAQRTREIGVRMALGAQRREIARMVIADGTTLAATGLAIGIGASIALTRTAQSLLFNVTPTDPATFVVVSAGVGVVAVMACWVPARRAARVNPLDAIRAE
ncbi:MAG TPA: ABC transporter permease [Vicinamibacterales bacterium]|nr:ABC transporter permease [Vicinamibacterales bacterium]